MTQEKPYKFKGTIKENGETFGVYESQEPAPVSYAIPQRDPDQENEESLLRAESLDVDDEALSEAEAIHRGALIDIWTTK